MATGFWKKLSAQGGPASGGKKPIMALAPMANVTDCAFRRIIAYYGKPDVMWTEFVSCDGLQSPGREKLLIDFRYTEAERPIVAQIFGSKPDNFYKTAQLCQELGFDGIDINMGCPDKNVEKQGAGACLIKNPQVAQEVIRATMRGAGKLPVSVKTRIGYNKNELATWIPTLLETGLATITVHCRTRKEMSLVPARWEHVAEAVAIRDAAGSQTLILGNGDVANLIEAEKKVAETGADGVMIGCGIFGNPWCFSRTRRPKDITLVERLRVMVEHTYLFEKLLSEHKNFQIMKKHYKAYVNGFDGAKELRIELMEKAEDAATVEEIVEKFIKYNLSS